MQTAFTLDEIVFEGRNRAYGAYALRQLYRPTLTRAIGIGVGVFLLAVSAPTLYARLTDRSNQAIMTEVTLTKVKMVEPLEKTKPIEPEKIKLPTPKTVRSVVFEVRPDDEVKSEELPPTVDELADANPDHITQEGTGDSPEIIAPPEETAAPTKTETVVELAPVKDEPFVAVEQNPEFPGGMTALRDFLQKNLRYPNGAVQAGIQGKVYVSFVVNTDGTLTDVQTMKGIGFGCDEEALRVIRQMPRWKPGRQAGRAVRVKFNLPVAFTLE